MKNEYDPNLALVTGGFDHYIRMWNPSTGKYLHGFQHSESQVNALAFSSDGRFLAAAGYGRVRVYDVNGSANPTVTVSDFSKNVNTLGFNDEGTWIFAGSEDRVAKILDWRAGGNLLITRVHQANSSINSMLLRGNQREIVMATDRGELIIWDLRNNKTHTVSTDPEWYTPIHSVAINPDGTSLAACNSAGQLIVWSLTSDPIQKPLEKYREQVHPKYALKVQFSPDSTLISTCGSDSKFSLRKTADFTEVINQKVTPSGLNWVWDCAFSADSRFLLTASSDGIARLWNLETSEVTIEYVGHQRAITCMAFRDQSLD